MTNTDTSPLRWHANANPNLRDSFDTIDAHQRRVCSMCISLAAFIGHPLTGSELPWAARHHDEAERFLGDMPAPAKARFPMLAEQYAIAERQILAEMSLSWTLTAKEQQMLHLCDKLDAYTWARKHGARGPEWDAAHVMLMVMADKFNAREWVKAEMEARG